ASLAATLALDGLPGFAQRFKEAIGKARELFAELTRLPGLSVEPFEHGSNIFPLRLAPDVDAARLAARLAEHDVSIAAPEADAIYLTVNTTLLRRPNEELVAAFRDALR